jgi:hypothetical protein
MKVILKWTNKFSHEEGFVKSVSDKEKHFINTYDCSEAKQYSEKNVDKVLKKLESYGEANNNDFEIICC